VSRLDDDPQLRRTARRLALQAAALILLCLVAGAAVQWVFVERASESAAKARLAGVTGRLDKPGEAPRDMFVTIVDAKGERSSVGLPVGLPVRADLTAVAATGRTRERSLRVSGHEYLVRTERTGSRTIQASLDGQPLEEESHRLILALLWAGIVGVVLAALAASWLARRAVAPMAETIALQRRFVADASHELRTPLTLLSTRIQLLVRRLRSDHAELRPDLEGLLSDTRSLTEILEELLLAVDSRQMQDRQRLDLRSVADDTVASARAEAQSRGLVLELDAPDPVVVEAAAPAVRRALLALVDNGLDHAVSRVHVSVVREGRKAVVRVEDDGPGIAPEVLPRVFERFSSSREVAAAGSGRRHYGLGLALVADIARAHGGRVSARNRGADLGAVMTLELRALD
jgi:two-component system, OmpR family, sensor kinase